MPPKKTPRPAPPLPLHITEADVSAYVKLIREAKAAGVAFFEGPNGLKFGFKREAPAAVSRPGAVHVVGDEFIP